MKMIEDISEAENIFKNVKDEKECDSIEISNEISNGIENCNAGLASTSSLSENKIVLETPKHVNNFYYEKLSPPEKEVQVLLQTDQNPEIDVITSDNQSAHGRRGPSPLLFTPVKGEETYGAGLLSQRVNSHATPTTAEKVRSTRKNFPPLFCTPSPKLINKTATELDGSGSHVCAGMKRSNQDCADSSPDKSNNKSSSEFKVKHSRSEYINSPNKSNGSPIQVPHHFHAKKLEFPIVSPSPSKCFEPDLNAPAAQIDSSPSLSECSDASLFITPKKEKINVEAQKLKLTYRNTQIITKRKHRLRTLVSRARHSLSGIPPPPSFTIPQISVDEMLLKLRSGAIFVGFDGYAAAAFCSSTHISKNAGNIESPSISLDNRTKCNIGTDDVTSSMVGDIENIGDSAELIYSRGRIMESEAHMDPSSSSQIDKVHSNKICESHSLFHPSASEKDIIDMSWPAVLDCVHLGVCYNLGTSSETLEELCQLVREKYVGNETASSCTIWSASNSSKRSSPRQRKNSNSQANTQAREGYMMRRRRAFTLASLSSTIPSMATKTRQILVNRVTRLSAESKKPKKLVDDKANLMSKDVSKISLLKKFFEDQEGNSKKLKRSYSFNDSSVTGGHFSSSSASEPSLIPQSSSQLLTTKRVLKFDRLPRATSSPSLDASSSQLRLGASTSSFQKSCDNIISVLKSTPDHIKNLSSHSVGTTNKDLSEVYKKKLLWAVAEALRSRGLGTGHEKFKVCAIPLFRCCRDAFLGLPSVCTGASASRNSEETSSERSCDANSNGSTDSQKERTSDKMLSIALKLVDQVMNEVGVEPVIKDKYVLL